MSHITSLYILSTSNTFVCAKAQTSTNERRHPSTKSSRNSSTPRITSLRRQCREHAHTNTIFNKERMTTGKVITIILLEAIETINQTNTQRVNQCSIKVVNLFLL